ncbi:MAG: hypothetical protein QM520_06710, partial [Gammaproteobacteria bacterium]|nr:hypothetical protein [Gammaproteobacteria bacterium]
AMVEIIRDEGKVEGKIEGRIEGKEEIARAMILEGEVDDKIKKYTKLSDDQITILRQSIKK